MEENGYGWIMWLVIILVSVVSGGVKSRRKIREQNNTANENNREKAETVLTRFFGDYADEQVDESIRKTEEEGSVRTVFEQRPAATRQSSTQVRSATTTSRVGSAKGEGGRATTNVSTENVMYDDDAGGESFDFNLRDAVIYSEIMHPKFDE